MQPSFNRFNRSSGITLPEIMIAFLILAMSMLPISGLIGFGHKGTQKDFRTVQAIELLVEKMNQVVAVPFKGLEANNLTGTPPSVTLNAANATISSGGVVLVQLGDIVKGSTTFRSSATLIKHPVTFTYRPINFSNPAYTFDPPNFWIFDAEKPDTYDGSVNYPYKVMKVIVKIDWIEPQVNKPRSVEAMSFAVDLED